MARKTLTILFADVQGYTARTGKQTRQQNEIFIQEIKSFVERHVREKGGRVVKTMGDGFLAVFESPTDAVNCGKDMQREIDQRNANVLNQDNFIKFRIGISTGEVTIDEHGDVFGDAVNIAARIQKFAEPHDVYISEATYLAMNKSEIKTPCMCLGPQRFKNVMQEVKVYRVFKDLEARPPLKKKQPVNKNHLLIGGIGAVLIFSVAFFLLTLKRPSPQHTETQNQTPTTLRTEPQNQIPIPIKKFEDRRHTFPRNKPPLPERKPGIPVKLPPYIKKFIREGNYTAVISWCETQLKENPDDVRIHELASDAYVKINDYAAAETHLTKALELDPEYTLLYYKLAVVYELSGQYDSAINVLQEYLQREQSEFDREKARRKIEELQKFLE